MTAMPDVPACANTVNPFIITDDAATVIDFIVDVFGAKDVPEARTLDTDGLILHSELRLGDSLLMVADRKPGWPFTPAFTRVYADDVEATLARAQARGARIVTRPTGFFGETLSRFQDPSGNLWWVYRHDPSAAATSSGWSDESGGEGSWSEEPGDGGGAEDWSSFSTPELEYIHQTLIDTMSSLRDPKTR
ncbi:VOC family protein [Nonomuraea fastidiosa]|uniref:VOC family protein n=1 Tax=Nonomuraea fastidiosa TaxID=46173 RepID=UPI00366F80C3